MEIEGAPILTLAPANDSNRPYFNALAKRSARNASRLRRGKIDTKILEDNRKHDLELFPKYVVKGWPRAPKDSQGNAVDFCEAHVAAFLSALPNWIFDRMRAFAVDAESFLPDDSEEVDEDDVIELGNSSPIGSSGNSSSSGTGGRSSREKRKGVSLQSGS